VVFDPTDQRRRPGIVNVARKITIFCIALLSISLIILTLVSKYLQQEKRADEMRESYEALQKGITSREVERVIDTINERRSNLREKALTRARQRVHRAHDIAQNIHAEYKDTKSGDEVLQLILAALEPVRFDGGNGYYFVITLDGEILHAADTGTSRNGPDQFAKSKNRDGVFSSLREIVNRKKEGAFEYEWPKPGDDGSLHEKLSYVKLFEPYDLILGTGLYRSDLEEELKREVKAEVSQLRFGENGYFFINTLQGDVLAHGAQDEMVGTSIWSYEDPRGNMVFQQLREAIQKPEGGFSFYWWRMPETGAERPKIAFTKAVPGWNWLIGTGLYVDEVEADIAVMQAELRQQSLREVLFILVLSTLIIGLVYILIGFMFRSLRRDIAFFEKSFGLAAEDDVSIDEEKIKFRELHNMAKNANKMLHDKAQFLKGLNEDKQQLAITLDSIKDAVIATNREYEVVLLNTVAGEMLDTEASDCIGNALLDILHFRDENSGATVPFPLQEALEKQSPLALPEHIYLVNKRGEKFNIECVASPITDHEGRQQGLIVVIRDITKELKAQEERIRLEKLESIGILAGGIAHDFNNLLTSLIGNIDLVRVNLDPKHRANQYLLRAERAIESAKQLATQFLTFSKGGEPLKSVVSLKDELVTAAEFNLRGSNVQLSADVADDLLPVEADLSQINQVISNLVINAQQAMPAGGEIHLSAQNKGGDSILITIRDEGEGMPESIKEKIFDPYFTTKGSGNGLGLASCLSIISKHGGSISVESEPGRGSTFTIELPVSDSAVSEGASAGTDQELDTLETLSAKILIIDDMDTIRELLCSILVEFGCEVVEASNGREALEAYKEARQNGSPFDLVITDLTIPGEEGGEHIAKSILEIHPDARIIASSGYSDSHVIAEYKKYGFIAYILKPYRVMSLIETVRDALNDAR
jgi:PAS domain S-box-containing protein